MITQNVFFFQFQYYSYNVMHKSIVIDIAKVSLINNDICSNQTDYLK